MKITRLFSGTDGESHFEESDTLLAEDTTGRGHISRAIDGKPRKPVLVTLA